MTGELELPFSKVTRYKVETRNDKDVAVRYADAVIPDDADVPAGVRKHGTTPIDLADTPINGAP